MGAQLRALDAAGNYSEELPDFADLTISQDLLDPGTLAFRYPAEGRHADLLTHGRQLAILIDGVEPKNGRYTYFEGDGSTTLGEAQPNSYGCTSNMGRTDKLMLAPAYGSTVIDDELFNWTNLSPGSILISALSNAMSRANAHTGNAVSSWLVTPPTTFSATLDSSGTAWPATYDTKFGAGTTVKEVIEWLTTNGLAEAHMQGRELKLYRPDKNGTNLTLGAYPIVLQSGNDLSEASYQTKSTDLVTALLVLGDENACVWVYDIAAIAQYGYREGKIQVSNASTQATLTAAGTAWLNARKIPRWSYTYAVSALYLEQTPNRTQPRPFVDYQCGDSILILDGGATAVQRLRLLSATWPTAQSSIVALTVNDLLAERDILIDRQLSQLGLGSL